LILYGRGVSRGWKKAIKAGIGGGKPDKRGWIAPILGNFDEIRMGICGAKGKESF
jgi:hypothetical protein